MKTDMGARLITALYTSSDKSEDGRKNPNPNKLLSMPKPPIGKQQPNCKDGRTHVGTRGPVNSEIDRPPDWNKVVVIPVKETRNRCARPL